MTAVTVRKTAGTYRLTARGHAAGSQQGCAFLSGILYALAGYLVNAAEAGHAEVTALRLEPGDAVLCARGGRRVGAAYDMAVIGLRQLERQRPDLVRVEILRD